MRYAELVLIGLGLLPACQQILGAEPGVLAEGGGGIGGEDGIGGAGGDINGVGGTDTSTASVGGGDAVTSTGASNPSSGTSSGAGGGSGNLIVFVTQALYTPAGSPTNDGFSSLMNADELCSKEAGARGSNEWRAWLSHSTISAVGRLGAAGADGPWVLPDGTLVFGSRADIEMGNGPQVPINQAFDMTMVTEDLVFTGTTNDGAAAMALCADWSVQTGSTVAGDPTDTVTWSSTGQTHSCGFAARLYCFQVPAPGGS